MNCRIKLYSFLIFLLPFFEVKAQETLMTEISYPYLDKLIRLARENYPRMMTFEKQIAIADANVQRAKYSWFDVLNFAYMRNKNMNATITDPYLLNGYQYGVNLNIGTLLQKPSQIRAAKEQKDIAALLRDEYRINLEADVKQRYFQYVQRLVTLKLITRSVLDAENNLKSIRNKFEKGELGFEAYNQSSIAVNGLHQQKIEAEATLLSAKASLEEIVGVSLELIHAE